ncbi:MAG: thiolase C-terminal domain-containing protein [Myxococcota bacterium]
MKLHRKTFVAGGAHTSYLGKFHPDFIWKGHPEFGKKDNPTIEQYLKTITDATLASTGVDPELIDKAYVANFAGECFINQGHLGAALAGSHPALAHKPIMRVEGACASGGLALVSAIDAIQAGFDAVLVVGAEIQNSANAKVGADYLARAAHYASERSIDPFTFPCLFAKRAKALYAAFGITEEDVAQLAVKAYNNANRNPFAHMRTVKMSLADALSSPKFLENPEYKDFLRVSGCSQVSDGASAVILLSEEGARKAGLLRDQLVEVLGYGHATGSLYQLEDELELTNTRKAAERLYADTGISAQDVQVAEVHDCFSVTEIMMYEALGFAARGQGVGLVREGATQIDGKIPVNTGGGLVAFGHPVGATGVKQALELYRQLKGQAGAYQVAGNPNIGVAANMGGNDRTAVVTAYRA